MSNSDFVSVPVPAERVQEVYALLARPPGDLPEPPEPEWTDSDIRKMFRESPDTMKTFLLHLARNTGDTFLAGEMATAIGRQRRQLAGALGAFSRRLSQRYGRKTWPFDADWNHEAGMVSYSMSESVADVILEEASR
jgi:hypothetical protein